jgi:membrane protease YdiL (CAAX protease family)
VREVLKHVVVFLLWNLVLGTFLLLVGGLTGLALALALSAALFWRYLLAAPRKSTAMRRWATLRLRPLDRDSLLWTLAAVPVLLALSYSTFDLYTRLIPVPAETLNPFAPITGTPVGRMSLAVFAIAVAPVIEEFFFRGLIQRKLERRWGAAVGIAGGAALFALVHVLPWVLPLHFLLGAAFGFAVWATRSIWAGVVLHAANNVAAMIGIVLAPGDPEPIPTLWEAGVTMDVWGSVLLLLASAFAAVWVGGRMYAVGCGRRLRRS